MWLEVEWDFVELRHIFLEQSKHVDKHATISY